MLTIPQADLQLMRVDIIAQDFIDDKRRDV